MTKTAPESNLSSHAFPSTSLSLLRRACANDQQAWRQLVHLYGPLVLRWCHRSRLQENDIEDVFQETFRSVAARLSSFSPQRSVGSFRSWLRTIVRTKIVDHFRRLKLEPPGQGGTQAQVKLANIADPGNIGSEVDSEEETLDDNALVVRRAMDLIKPEFSPQNWAAFWRVAVEGRSAVEVAERLSVNAQAVRQANYRIRRRLRSVLQDLIE